MAAQRLAEAGVDVTIADAMPTMGRKFLMAGKSGLNLTKAEAFDTFAAAYGAAQPHLLPMLSTFGPDDVRAWATDLGIELFTGSTARVFPVAMKASPLLRAWLAKLDQLGVQRHTRWRWTGWDGAALCFDTPNGPVTQTADVTVLALGGASWRRLGSDGEWAQTLASQDIPLAPFQPSNAGLLVSWSDHMTKHFGAPLKNVAFCAGGQISRGEAVISARGLEGGGLYHLTPHLRSGAELLIDLQPDRTEQDVAKRLSGVRGKPSVANQLRKGLGLGKAAIALAQEMNHPLPRTPNDLAAILKSLPVRYSGLRPIDEAISTAGGVRFDSVDDTLMLRSKPAVFVAGEMLDWEAPTGGYLLTACLSSGHWAGQNAAKYANQ